MYDGLLLPTDGSPHTTTAAGHALALARAFDATVHVLRVADIDGAAGLFDAGGVDDEFVERVEQEAAATVERTASLLAAAERVKTAVVDGDPGEAIVEYGTEHGVDGIVMGTHGRRGLRRFVAGSVTEEVVRTTTVPVFTVRRADEDGDDEAPADEPEPLAPDDLPRYETVLLPTDGSDTAAAAVDHAIAVAGAFDGELHALSVVDPSSTGALPEAGPSESVVESLVEQAEHAVASVADRAAEADVEIHTEVQQGFPARTILGYAEEQGVDIVVAGTHGRTGLGRVLLGSTAEHLVRRAEMPVCVVPAANRDAAMEEGDGGGNRP